MSDVKFFDPLSGDWVVMRSQIGLASERRREAAALVEMAKPVQSNWSCCMWSDVGKGQLMSMAEQYELVYPIGKTHVPPKPGVLRLDSTYYAECYYCKCSFDVTAIHDGRDSFTHYQCGVCK